MYRETPSLLTFIKEIIMRYFILWLLGVPVSLLVLLYFFGIL